MTPLLVVGAGAGGLVAGLKSVPEFRAQVEKNAPFITENLTKMGVDLDAPVSFKMPDLKVPNPMEKKEAKKEPAPAPPAPEPAPAAEEPAVYVKSIEDEIKDIGDTGKKLWLDSVDGAMTEVHAQSRALQRELADTKLKGIEKMDNDGLKRKVVELVELLQERSKWEAIRMHETLKTVEQDTA